MNKQVLPALVTLSNDADMGVRELSIEALAEVSKLYGASPAVMDKLTTHLDSIMSSNVHEVTFHAPCNLSNDGRSYPSTSSKLHARPQIALGHVLQSQITILYSDPSLSRSHEI